MARSPRTVRPTRSLARSEIQISDSALAFVELEECEANLLIDFSMFAPRLVVRGQLNQCP